MKLITILGPTSSGKSSLALSLAKTLIFKGYKSVILNCDSRQIYKGLNLLSGKEAGSWIESNILDNEDSYVIDNIEHFLIDFVPLSKMYTLSEYINDYITICNKLNGKVDYVILVGGTGLYARAVTEEYQLGIIKNNDLNNLSLAQLQQKLNHKDFNDSDWGNRIRLINSLIRIKNQDTTTFYPKFDKKYKFILTIDKNELASKVKLRIISRIEQGLLEELSNLLKTNSRDRLYKLGLESRIGLYYIENKLSIQQFTDLLTTKTLQFIKRQNTWNSKEPSSITIKSLEDILKNIKLSN